LSRPGVHSQYSESRISIALLMNIVSRLLLPDLTPNSGLWWYFFTEMFDHFRPFFLVAFTVRRNSSANGFIFIPPSFSSSPISLMSLINPSGEHGDLCSTHNHQVSVRPHFTSEPEKRLIDTILTQFLISDTTRFTLDSSSSV
jgi:hypothetical protein